MLKHYLNYRNLNIAILLVMIVAFITSSVFCARLCVCLILLLCFEIGNKEKYVVNPMFLFALAPFSLLIYRNLGDNYMLDIEFKTWGIAMINMYAFILSYKKTPSFISIRLCTGDSHPQSLQIQAVIFFLISLTGMLIPQISSIVWIFSIAAIVCALKSRKKVMYLFSIAIFLFSALGVTSKSTMLTLCLTFIVCFEKYFADNEKKRKWVKVVLAIGVVFMLFTFSFANKDRGKYDAEEGVEEYMSRGIDWDFSAGLFMPYMYLTNGWTNLQYVMDTQDTRTYGLWFIKPLLGYLQADEGFKDKYTIIPYSSFNTCAYMTYGFKDFGYWLSIIMSIFLGFFVKKVYSRYRLSRSPYDLVAYALVAQATLEMFFSNHFFILSYPFTAVILMSFVKVIMRLKGAKPELEIK